MLKAKLNRNSNKLSLYSGSKVIRSIVNPLDKGAYKFNYQNEECHFIYEDFKIVGHKVQKISLYPIDLFKPNNIIPVE